MFYADVISAVDLVDSQLVTLKLESGNYLRFQPDTGAQCNVIPVSLYKKATNDHKMELVTPLNAQLAANGGSKLQVVGQVRMTVWRTIRPLLRPLLGRNVCVGMKTIKYTDNDQLNKPQTGSAPVYSLESSAVTQITLEPITREALIKKYP